MKLEGSLLKGTEVFSKSISNGDRKITGWKSLPPSYATYGGTCG
jgi:hypothetical protein